MLPSLRSTFAVLTVLAVLTALLTQLGPTQAPASLWSEKAITYKPIVTPDDIEALTPPLIKPVAYTQVSSLATLEVSTKKQKFFDMILPAVLISKARLREKRERVQRISTATEVSTEDQTWLNAQFKKYRAVDIKQLNRKLRAHPNSIILAQAALETGWGTSRFFLKGNNIFGVWSFNAAEPRMKASQDRDGQAIYVKRYKSLIEAVDDYFVTIARNEPYKAFRHARMKTQDPLELIQYLDSYSEIGEEYVRRLRSLIERNDMRRFDSYKLQTAQPI